MKFNIEDYKGRYAMHCKTIEEAEDFCNYLYSANKYWRNEESYINYTYWEDYKEDTCYAFNFGTYRSYKYFQNQNNYIILEWSKFMNNNTFTKTDLETGDIVVKRNGTEYMYINDYFVNNDGYERVEYYNDVLTRNSSYPSIDHDIVKVKRPSSGYQYRQKFWDEAPVIWERKEVEEMTLEEICKALGKEIKIIKSK